MSYIYGVFKHIYGATYGQLIANGGRNPALFLNLESATEWCNQMQGLYPTERYKVMAFVLDPNGVTCTGTTYTHEI